MHGAIYVTEIAKLIYITVVTVQLSSEKGNIEMHNFISALRFENITNSFICIIAQINVYYVVIQYYNLYLYSSHDGANNTMIKIC